MMNARKGLEMASMLMLFALIFCLIPFSDAKRGFILTAPKVLDVGTIEYLTLTVFDVPNESPVSIKLMRNDDEVIAETTVLTRSGHNKWVRMIIPDVPYTKAQIHVSGTFNVPGGYQIDQKKEVRLRRSSVMTFIQTDKPIYKPGQTVRFRVMPLDNQLIPLSGSTVGDLWVEDPSKIRVAQWPQADLSKGIVQFDLPLSEEPPHGVWKIHANIRNFSVAQSFKVYKYVLPKFEVSIHLPDYLLIGSREYPVKICAIYTYGKNVDGQVHTRIFQDRNTAYSTTKDNTVYDNTSPISGCTNFTVRGPSIHLRRNMKVKVVAEVLESTTGISQNASAFFNVADSPLELQFLGADRNSHYFKPGLPFYGKVQVVKPNKQPVSFQVVRICAKPVKENNYTNTPRASKLCNTFHSNRDGIIEFIIPPQDSSTEKISVEAIASDTIEEGRDDKQYPSAEIYLKPWYSPTNSYLQIEPLPKDIPCDQLQRVTVLYTSTQESDIKFYHQVMARGRIVQLGSHSRSFGDSSSSHVQLPGHLLLHETAFVRPVYRRKSPVSKPINYTEFKLSFDVRNAMSHVARLLVYYITDGGEVVADTRKVDVKECLRNDVKFLFRHSVQYPDTEAPMLLSASPMSFCGISMVDKSVHLMDKENRFSKEKVFSLLQYLDVGKNSEPRQTVLKMCRNEDNGRNKRSLLPGYSSSLLPNEPDKFDSVAAYEEAGAIVMTDFNIHNSPCVHPIFVLPRRGSNQRFDPLDAPIPFTAQRARPMAVKAENTDSVPIENTDAEPLEIRSYFPETWLWELQEIGSSGEIALKRNLPHTITEWMGTAVCIHPKQGLGISDEAKIVSYQPFFASFTLPYSVVKGESVPVLISVFNYLSDCLTIRISLEPSDSFKILSISTSAKICVCGGKSGSHKFLIQPNIIGTMNLTAYAYSLDKDDNVCGNKVTAKIGGRDAVTRQLIVEVS